MRLTRGTFERHETIPLKNYVLMGVPLRTMAEIDAKSLHALWRLNGYGCTEIEFDNTKQEYHFAVYRMDGPQRAKETT